MFVWLFTIVVRWDVIFFDFVDIYKYLCIGFCLVVCFQYCVILVELYRFAFCELSALSDWFYR